MLKGTGILLVIAGSIAAYKSLDLIRPLGERGLAIRAILTRGGAEFVTPLSVASLTGAKAYSELFSLPPEAEMGPTPLPREADPVMVTPARAALTTPHAAGIT